MIQTIDVIDVGDRSVSLIYMNVVSSPDNLRHYATIQATSVSTLKIMHYYITFKILNRQLLAIRVMKELRRIGALDQHMKRHAGKSSCADSATMNQGMSKRSSSSEVQLWSDGTAIGPGTYIAALWMRDTKAVGSCTRYKSCRENLSSG